MVLVAPSLLSSDFSILGREIQLLEKAGADWIHFDSMDGNFVPNITIGPMVVSSMRRHSKLTFDVHLMIDAVDLFIPAFAEAGADLITVHVEATPHLDRTLQLIRSLGKKAGVALNPGTPLESLKWILHDIDMVLVMTVNPGFAGQRFISAQLEKISALRVLLDQATQKTGKKILIQADGGIQFENVAAVREAGADVIVAGTAIFQNGPDKYAQNIARLKEPLRR